MLRILAPKAMNPPSAKARHWITSTEASVISAAHGPSMADSRMPPTKWPLDPVPGIEKLIIWAAKTNAPMTPISGTMRSLSPSASRRSFFACFTFQAATPQQGQRHGSRGDEYRRGHQSVGHVHRLSFLRFFTSCRPPAAAWPGAFCFRDSSSSGRVSPPRRT